MECLRIYDQFGSELEKQQKNKSTVFRTKLFLTIVFKKKKHLGTHSSLCVGIQLFINGSTLHSWQEFDSVATSLPLMDEFYRIVSEALQKMLVCINFLILQKMLACINWLQNRFVLKAT